LLRKLFWGAGFLAGWWFIPKSLWFVAVLCLAIGINLIFKAMVDFYRQHFQGLTREQAFDLVNEVLQPMAPHPEDQFSASWCEVLQVYANAKPKPARHFTEEQRSVMNERLASWGAHNPDYKVALRNGLIAVDEYDSLGTYVLTEFGTQHGKLGTIGGYEFYLNKLKQYRLENARSTRKSASATFVLEFERTELAVALKHIPVLRRTFDLKAERTDDGEWFLTELVETGLPLGPKSFPLAEFRNWQAELDADRRKEEERDKWHDEPDVKAALARYNAETDPEKKALLSEEWRETGAAARRRLGIS